MSCVSADPVIGVGIDTARYGHVVTFLHSDRQPAADQMTVTENEQGYSLLRTRLEELQRRFPEVLFRVRIDAAGQYATNLERFLRRLPHRMSISIGEPKRNKDYHAAVSPKRATDHTESYAMARYAVAEAPPATAAVSDEFFALREIVSRLEAQSRDVTRMTNRLHNVLARVFPELATLVRDLKAMWVLRMLQKYPTPARIAAAHSLEKIPYLKAQAAQNIQAAARKSVGTFRGPLAEELVRECVRQLQERLQGEKRLKELTRQTLQTLPVSGHVHVASIPGIGVVTAAVLVAKIVDIRRFETADNLVGYFGTFPEMSTSGVDHQGRPIPRGTTRMSPQGSDIVRCYLWNAAKCAINCNPAVRALYARLRARGTRGDVALGHCMRKLLHQVFGVWSTSRDFDQELSQPRLGKHQQPSPAQPAAHEKVQEKMVAGRKRVVDPNRKAVTATDSSVAESAGSEQAGRGSVDYAWLREQITIGQILERLGYARHLRGRGAQRRGPCPFHPHRQGSTSFTVHLDKHVFRCQSRRCGAQGNALDLWARAQGLALYEAAVTLADAFDLPLRRTEKRPPVT